MERKILLGTIVNASVIIVGAIAGNFLKGYFSEGIKTTVMQGISLTVILIGITMAWKTENVLIVILSMVVGGVLGELLRLEERLESFGKRIENSFDSSDGHFARAFVTSSLVFCVGAMAIMGALESGLTGNHTTLYAKSMLDGVASVVFASSMGMGVAFAALPVFFYQGAITLAASSVKAFLSAEVIREMTATGGLLILAIGFNMLNEKLNIKVGNLLPAIFVAIFLVAAVSHFKIFLQP